jgi:phosphatidylserine/phosphatidylglycerophosphate/cardiolipin synthase-like enzyme
MHVGDARVRVFFPPEPTKARKSIDVVVNAINGAKRSVMFCLFSPTDPPMLKALLDAGDKGKLMFGLLNSIKDPTTKKKVEDPEKVLAQKPSAANQMQVEVFHRSRKDRKIVDYDRFSGTQTPAGFLPEQSTIDTSSKVIGAKPKQKQQKPRSSKIPPVHIHHKFIVIDGETSHPKIFVGSANMSNNSVHNNDENLLEITGSLQLGQAYVAEFLRLYDHYRARALWDWSHNQGKKRAAKTKGKGGKAGSNQNPFILKTTRDEWVKDAYKSGTANFLLRTDLAKVVGT